MQNQTSAVKASIKKLLSQKNYPCVAAVQSFFKNEYRLSAYQGFGTGLSTRELANDLSLFQTELRQTQSPYLSFFASFPGSAEMNEEQFELALWKEISCLAADERFSAKWDPQFSSDPSDTNFCFSFNGEAFFVVGLFPGSSRRSRRLDEVVLIFNSFNQFEILKKKGIYNDMIKVNRQRDLLFDGSVNPMSEKYGEQWEAIQFSGRNNSSEWKCPFSHLRNFFKS